MALGVVLTKRWGRPDGVSALSLAGWQLTAGGLVLLIPTLVLEGVPAHIDWRGIAGYLWLGLVGGLLTYTIWFSGIRRLPVTSTAMLSPLSPLVAAVLGAVLLGQTLNLIQLAGFVLAVTAMLAGQLTPHTKTTRCRATGTADSVTPHEPAVATHRALQGGQRLTTHSKEASSTRIIVFGATGMLSSPPEFSVLDHFPCPR
jgi:probable blue pigment (indigoidine) exporter